MASLIPNAINKLNLGIIANGTFGLNTRDIHRPLPLDELQLRLKRPRPSVCSSLKIKMMICCLLMLFSFSLC